MKGLEFKFIYCFLLSIIIFLAYVLLKDYFSKNIKMKFKKKPRFSKEFSRLLHENEETLNPIFEGTGLNLFKYNLIRISILSFFIMIIIISLFREESNFLNNIVTLTILIIILIPQTKFAGRKTPFGILMKFLKEYNEKAKNEEIYRAIIQLKNIAIAQKDTPLGGEYIILHLLKFTKKTKGVFSKMLSLWRLGEEKEATEYFSKEINTKLAKEFSGILLKLDQINPIELVENLELYQSHIREEKATARLKQQETISNIVYMPIIASAFAILLNFVLIVFWMDSMSTILNL